MKVLTVPFVYFELDSVKEKRRPLDRHFGHLLIP